jgi:mannose-1-phosphate guanylyltransferase/mannose-1-phosphate guanylyltransferase/mannose-6-phosphate isomerase
MFQFTAGAFLDELRQYAPAIHDATRASIAGASSSGSRVRPDPDALERSPSDSIDYAVMEHSHRIAVVPLDMQWSDVGSWAAVHKLSSKDEDGNVAENGHAIDSRNCLIRSSGPTVVAIGVEDLVIVATPDHVLVVPRSEAQRVREAAALAEKLAKKG